MDKTMTMNPGVRLQALTAAAVLMLAGAAVRAAPATPAVPPAPPVPPEAAAALAEFAESARQLALADLPVIDTQAFIADELATERPVKGAPYCADAVHETVQLLPDPSGAAANRIVRRQQTRLCRDGEGRTRQEVERDGQRRIYLRDPVARESWVLDPAKRTARRLGAASLGSWEHAQQMEAHSAAWREYSERMREWARSFAERMKAQAGHGASAATPPTPPTPPTPLTPPTPPTPVVVMADEANGSREMQVRVLRTDGAAASEVSLPPGIAMRIGSLAPRGPGAVSSLGSKDIEGLRANGERTTWTIEAGKFGNEKPIVISREVWRSPDLLLTVQSSDFDPRSGETRYRLTNLKRGEPEAGLMQVPADYQRRGVPGAPSAPAPGASRGRG